jgi:hypothetical protein
MAVEFRQPFFWCKESTGIGNQKTQIGWDKGKKPIKKPVWISRPITERAKYRQEKTRMVTNKKALLYLIQCMGVNLFKSIYKHSQIIQGTHAHSAILLTIY